MTDESTRPHKAGAFDIVQPDVTKVGGFTSDADKAKAAGVNINLWAGIGMLVFTVLFVLWARLRPIIVPPEATETTDTPPAAGE